MTEQHWGPTISGDIVVIGGGSAGIGLLASLLKRDPDLNITLIEPSDHHCYQPAWTLVGGGAYDLEKTRRPLADVLPTIFQKYPVRYRDYTLRQLCQEMHDLYVSFDVKDLQKAMFRKESLPEVVMNPQDANRAYIRGDVELVRIRDAAGRIAAEGALPYPPGVLCVVPGEVWGGAVQRYFLALEEGINLLPGFSPELQGVYSEKDADGIKRLYGYVLR